MATRNGPLEGGKKRTETKRQLVILLSMKLHPGSDAIISKEHQNWIVVIILGFHFSKSALICSVMPPD